MLTAAFTDTEQPLFQNEIQAKGGEPMETETGTTERRSLWTPEVVVQAFKEVITALLGLAVVIYTLILAGNTLTLVGQPEELSDAKDVLLLILGLAGVVLGYYFGRVPADARASQAQQQANDATAQAEQVNAQAQVIADEVDAVVDRMARPAIAARGAEPTAEDVALAADLHRIRDDLRSLSKLSRRR
jgi:hypothetical protein